MLKKKFRLTDFDFKNFFKGQRKRNNLFLVYKLRANSKKFAILVQKKIIKKAVERNKIRRQIYDIIRKNLANLENGYYLIIPQKKESYQNLKNELLKLLQDNNGKYI
ncbi:MAG: ribonuclease P protein component [Patescibacteria group bacterium]|nr:ribonuclease P protein component [Patescibacteria group bacterium]